MVHALCSFFRRFLCDLSVRSLLPAYFEACRSFQANSKMSSLSASYFGVFLASVATLSQAGYTLRDDYNPSSFFSKFNFFSVCGLVRPLSGIDQRL